MKLKHYTKKELAAAFKNAMLVVIGTIILVTVLLNFFGNKFGKKDNE